MKRFQIAPIMKPNKPPFDRLLSDDLKAVGKAFKNNSGGDVIISAEYLDDWHKRIQSLVDLSVDYESFISQLLWNKRANEEKQNARDDDVLLAALHEQNSNVVLLGGEE